MIASAAAVVLVLGAVLLARPLVHLARWTLADRESRPHYLPALWHTSGPRWRWLTRSLHLGAVERVHRRRHPLLPVRPFATSTAVRSEPVTRLRWPRLRRLRVDAYGWSAEARTVPGVGRQELANASVHLANAWLCHRVAIAQPRPGYVQIRALRRDPLAELLPLDGAPAGAYPALAELAAAPRRLYLGRDGWGADRYASLVGLPAAVIGGLPNYGKTTLVASWLCQLAPSPAVELAALIDGKSDGGPSSDYYPWADRARILTGADLGDVEAALADVHDGLRDRLSTVVDKTGRRNAWSAGAPSPSWPLRVTVIDETHTVMDLEGRKGDRTAEQRIRRIRHLAGELVRLGRSVCYFTVVLSQKLTADSLPTGVRDNAPLSLSFAVKTQDAAVAALGADVRTYPDLSPVGLQAPEFVGVAVAQLRTGLDPYVRLRVPEVTEAAAIERAAAAAELCPTPARRGLTAASRPQLAAVPDQDAG